MANETDNLASLIVKLPKPAPVDEIKIMDSDEQKKERQNKQVAAKQPVDWVRVLWISLAALGILIVLIFSFPWFIWQYFNAQAKSNTSNRRLQAYHIYVASLYYLNQLGLVRNDQSPQQFAEAADGRFGSNFNAFTNVYQKIKYSSTPLTAKEENLVAVFYSPFIEQIKNKIPLKQRIKGFLNIYNTMNYFTNIKIS